MSARTIVIGDIHGCYDELRDLLDRLGVGADDRLVCVGDLIVKGPKNREVLDLFIDDKRFASVVGNHDHALRAHWRGERPSLKPAQRRAHDELSDDRERYAAYLDALPYSLTLPSGDAVVHAGVRPSLRLDEQAPEDLMGLRTLGPERKSREGVPWYEVYRGAERVLFGHWPASAPRRGLRALGLDTGCVYGYHLSAYVVETDALVSVPARRAYDSGPPGGV